jgi:hypothetical protein
MPRLSCLTTLSLLSKPTTWKNSAAKAAIEDVINSNSELEGLALKKAIKADSSVQSALAGDDLYDNQLNK